MSNYGGNSIFPIYLFFASIANVVFLYVSIRDLFDPNADKSTARVLLALSIAELIWVVPCWLQCLAKWISDGGDHWWIPNAASYDAGCDIMGIYSVFASVSGMYIVGLIAYMSHSTLVLNKKLELQTVNIAIALCYAMAILQCLLPAIGVGSLAYSGEGFCYIDWSNAGQAVCMEIVTVPIFITTCYWYGSCALFRETEESEGAISDRPLVKVPPRFWWWICLLAYVTAWFLWIPAIFIGLTSDESYPDMFPTGYLLTGGIMGHAQALINPALYGVQWKSWMRKSESEGEDGKPVSAVISPEYTKSEITTDVVPTIV